jgi:hypothetical protein
MGEREQLELFSALVSEFLSKPEGTYSQKSVVDALDALRVPAGNLILFLSQTLGLRESKDMESNPPEKPVVMISSMLVLTQRALIRSQPLSDSDCEAPADEDFLRILGKSLKKEKTDLAPDSGAPKSATGKKSKKTKQDKAALNPKSGNTSESESDDLIDELVPLQVQRSLSVPISGPKGTFKPPTTLAKTLTEKAGNSLDEDAQLLAIFKLSVWICKRPENVLSKLEKAAMLSHAIQNMNILAKRVKTVSSFV